MQTTSSFTRQTHLWRDWDSTGGQGQVLGCGAGPSFGADHLKVLISKGYKVANIIISFADVWWGAHLSLLLSVYRAIYRGVIEYGAQVFTLYKNYTLFLKIQRQQFRIIRTALDLRQSTPINVLPANLPSIWDLQCSLPDTFIKALPGILTWWYVTFADLISPSDPTLKINAFI